MFTGGVGFLFEFFESGIFLEVLDVVGQVGFLLFDFFFFDLARGRSGLTGTLGHDRQIAVGSVVVGFVVCVRRFTAEHRGHVHLVQALLFAVPVA